MNRCVLVHLHPSPLHLEGAGFGRSRRPQPVLRPSPHVNACARACVPEHAARGFLAPERYRQGFLGTALMMRDFDHRQLDVYRVSITFVAHADRLAGTLPRGRAALADQLRRASTSICLNTAEGAGEFSPGEKARFYRLARRSATECVGVLDICRALGIGDAPELDEGDELLYRIVSMLTKMILRAAPVD
jgi:four helix bundle protein